MLVAGLAVHAADGLQLKFKDGTALDGAEIYVPEVAHSTGMPDGRGVIIKYYGKLYIHHFPYRPPRQVQRAVDGGADDGSYKMATVTEALEHYQPRPSPLDASPRELIYSCTPSRLAFFHFDRPSMKVLRRAIARHPGIPNANRKAALASIQNAYYAGPSPAWYNTPQSSQFWQAEADRDVARYKQHVFYGKWIDQPALAPPVYQKLLRTGRKRAP